MFGFAEAFFDKLRVCATSVFVFELADEMFDLVADRPRQRIPAFFFGKSFEHRLSFINPVPTRQFTKSLFAILIVYRTSGDEGKFLGAVL